MLEELGVGSISKNLLTNAFSRWDQYLLIPFSVLQIILSILSLLDFFSFPHIDYPTFGPAEVVVFNSGFDFSAVLILLLGLSLVFFVRRGMIYHLAGSVAFSVLLCFFMEWGVVLAAVSFSVSLIILGGTRKVKETLFWAVLLFAGFEFLSLLYWALKPFGFGSVLHVFSDLERSLYYLGISLAPILSLGILFSWLISYIARYFLSPLRNDERLKVVDSDSDSKWIYRILGVLVLISISLIFYVYSSGVNPGQKSLGVDFNSYVSLLDLMGEDLFSAFRILDNSRPVVLLLLFFIKGLFGFTSVEAVNFSLCFCVH